MAQSKKRRSKRRGKSTKRTAPRSKKRNYKAEYKRRIQLALKRGYSRSVARGHARAKLGELSIKRATAMDLQPGLQIIRPRGATRYGYRPTAAERLARIRKLGLPLIEKILYGNKGRRFPGPREDDPKRDGFVQSYIELGFTPREAYTLWFSP